MKINELGIVQDTKITLHIEWTMYEMEQRLSEFNVYDYPREEMDLFFDERDEAFIDYKAYKYTEARKDPTVENKEIIGSALTTFNNLYLFEIALHEKRVAMEIEGTRHDFVVSRKVYDEETNTIHVYLCQATTSSGHFYRYIMRKPTGYEATKKELMEKATELTKTNKQRSVEMKVNAQQVKQPETNHSLIKRFYQLFQNKVS